MFPGVVKAGLGVGGQYGEGVLFRGGKATAYYNTAGASFGLQAGGQKYGYALFFLSEETLNYLDKSEGFEVGVGPSIVVADEGFAKSTTTTTGEGQGLRVHLRSERRHGLRSASRATRSRR